MRGDYSLRRYADLFWDMCNRCGALILDTELHGNFHEKR